MSNPYFKGPVRRRNYGKGHGYLDANGTKVPGVTTILGDGLPKKALINWAGNETANYAVDHWDELATMSPSTRLKKLQGGRYEVRDAAANKGTAVHDLAEHLVAGEEVDVPDALAGHVESYVQFLDDWEPKPTLIEAVVMSHKHGYAGTLDLAADIQASRFDPAFLAATFENPPGRDDILHCLVDLKTSRSGIFGETALQLAAYRYADVFVDGDGAEQPMPTFHLVLGLHCRADGYSLLPIEAGSAQLREFLYAREIARFAEEHSRSYIGEALVPPGQRHRRRVEIVAETATAVA